MGLAVQHRLFGSATPMSTDEWYTPRWIFDAVGYEFDVDVCAPLDCDLRTVPARSYFTVEDDGLALPWHGSVWMNPPYSRAAPWVDRWSHHADGLALLPALPEVAWLGVLLSSAHSVSLLSLDFHRPDGTKARLRWPCIIAGRGALSDAVGRIAERDRYTAGAWFRAA